VEHIAIDLGGRESQICRRSSDGTIVEERKVKTRALGLWLAKQAPSRVIVETCAEAFRVADEALAAGHQVRVVPATLVRSLGVGARRIKTDQRDAQVLSEVSCRIDLPSVHVPTKESRSRKAMCGMREALVSSRTQLVNTVRGWMRGQGLSLRGGTELLAARLRAAHQARYDEALPAFVERQLKSIESLTEQIIDADKELRELSAKDPVCRRLMTVPGVGPVTAVRFAAALDEVSRFADAQRVASYLGLVPGENSSSSRQQRLGITKAGSAALRRTLIQGAWTARRCRRKDPMQLWADEVERRRGKFVATVALARKMVAIMFAIWRDGTTYDPSKNVSKLPPETSSTVMRTVEFPTVGEESEAPPTVARTIGGGAVAVSRRQGRAASADLSRR
jgi:transposase